VVSTRYTWLYIEPSSKWQRCLWQKDGVSMIVTFKSKASGNLIYFKDVALKLLHMMGRDDKVPSALYAEDVASAITQLEHGLAVIAAEEQEKAAQSDDRQENSTPNGSTKPYISLNVRAQPLLQLLQKAQKKNCPVLWE
jgi:hypothetical protein